MATGKLLTRHRCKVCNLAAPYTVRDMVEVLPSIDEARYLHIQMVPYHKEFHFCKKHLRPARIQMLDGSIVCSKTMYCLDCDKEIKAPHDKYGKPKPGYCRACSRSFDPSDPGTYKRRTLKQAGITVQSWAKREMKKKLITNVR